jgi:transposase
MHDWLFEAALGIAAPWFVEGVRFNEASKVLTVDINFAVSSRFGVDGVAGVHPVHDAVVRSYRHLNFFQHECVLEVRTPRVRLPDGSVHLVKPPFAGELSGFTLLFEALALMPAPQTPFAAAVRIAGISSAYRLLAIYRRYVALVQQATDYSDVRALAIAGQARPQRGQPSCHATHLNLSRARKGQS